MNMHVWVPEAGTGPGLVLIQEIFGVGAYIRAVAERLAAAGYVVGAPDVFWRFAPGWEQDHDEAGLAASFEAVGKLDMGSAVADCVAAVSTLGELEEVDGHSGRDRLLPGRHAWPGRSPANDDPSVCVSYYGSGVPSMIDQIDNVTCPTLFHFGGTDDFIPNEGVEAVGAAIAGRPGFVLNVEDAGHAFDNHESGMFYNESAAKAAWSKTMAFLGEHLPVNAAYERDDLTGQSNSPGCGPLARSGAVEAEVGVRGRHRDAPAWRAGEHPLLDQERLVHVLDRLGLLADADRQRRQADRAAAELAAQGVEDGAVDLVEAELVDPEQRQPGARDVGRDVAVAADLGEVADPAQQAVGDARRAARAAGDLPRARLVDRRRRGSRRRGRRSASSSSSS